jgi:CBS domain containing-hemolysin-like protein
MIRGIEELSETTVKEVMIPRIDTVFLSLDAEREEILQTAITWAIPASRSIGTPIDNVEGVLYVKDLLRSWPWAKPWICPR